MVAEALLGKHAPLFDLTDTEYFHDDLASMRGVEALTNFSWLLKKRGLDDLNDRFLDKFLSFKKEEIKKLQEGQSTQLTD